MAIDERSEPVGGFDGALDADPVPGCPPASGGIGRQSPLRLLEPAFEVLAALDQPGVANLQITPARRQDRGLCLEPGPCLAELPGCFGLSCLVRFERRQERLELVDARPLALDPFGQFSGSPLDALDLGGGLAPLALYPGEGVGGCGEPGVVRVQATGEVPLGLHGSRELRLGQAHPFVALVEFGPSGRRSPLRASSTRLRSRHHRRPRDAIRWR